MAIIITSSQCHMRAECACGWKHQIESQFPKRITKLDETIFTATIRRHKHFKHPKRKNILK